MSIAALMALLGFGAILAFTIDSDDDVPPDSGSPDDNPPDEPFSF